MDGRRPRAGWLVTIGYGLIVGLLWHVNLFLSEDYLVGSDHWIAYALAVSGALVAEQGIGRLHGASLLLAIAVLPGLMAGAIATSAFPLRFVVILVAPVAFARCLVDMFASRRSDGFRRVAAALGLPFAFVALLTLVTGHMPRSRFDLSFVRTLPLLGLAAVPPVRRLRKVA